MISEERLQQALNAYDKALMAALPAPEDCDHRFSPRFEQRMRKVVRRAHHPVAYKTLQRAACLLLALLALFGGMIAFNPDVRAAVVNWVREQFGHFSHYYSPEDPSDATSPSAPAERKQYELGWLPEGYMWIDTLPGEDHVTQIYINGTGQILQFSYYYKTTFGPYFDQTSYTKKTVLLDDYTADIYSAADSSGDKAIVWTDSQSNVLFCVSVANNEEILIKIAEGITEKK